MAWYSRERRDLPWRVPLGEVGSPDPYRVLVSEAMLQQTQVATVVPYFHRFMGLFPTVEALASADPQVVLRAWQGLGYYSRARNLQAAAIRIVAENGGLVPGTVKELIDLPGIGRYTAGAIASIAFGRRVPILDGNVARVLCRLDGITGDPREPAVRERLWGRALEVLPRSGTGDFNSALMELGAMRCTPRSAKCLLCPVRVHCQAHAEGLVGLIPAAKKAKPVPLMHRRVWVIGDGERYLIEQRPAKGRWAGMWQFITVESRPGADLLPSLPSHIDLRTTTPTRLGVIEHALTHRRYQFEIFSAEISVDSQNEKQSGGESRRWVGKKQLDEYPMPRPHVRVLQMLEAAKLGARNAVQGPLS